MEVILRGVISGNPDLKLLSSAGILKLKKLIVAFLCNNGILRLIRGGGITVKSVVNTCHTVVARAVKNVGAIKLIRRATSLTGVGHYTVCIMVSENVCKLFTLNVSATGASRRCYTVTNGHIVTERLSFRLTTSLALAHLRIGTGSISPVVTDSRAVVVKSTNGTYCSITTRNVTVILMTECGNGIAGIVLATHATMVSGVTGGGAGGLYYGRGGGVSKSRNGSLLSGSNTTAGACDTGSKTGGRTSRSYSLKNHVVKVTESLDNVADDLVSTSGTGRGGAACFRTGRLGYNNHVIVALRLALNVLTSITGVRCGTGRL